jgi:hypothetical protein
MKTLLLVALAGLALVVGAVAAPNIIGSWQVEATFDDSSMAGGGFGCAFKQDAEELTGKCSGGTADVTGEVNGQDVTWRLDLKGIPTITFTGTLDRTASRIEGRFTVGDKGGSFTATKLVF